MLTIFVFDRAVSAEPSGQYQCADEVMSVIGGSGTHMEIYQRGNHPELLTAFTISLGKAVQRDSKSEFADPNWCIGSGQTGFLAWYCQAPYEAILELSNRHRIRFRGDDLEFFRGFQTADYLNFLDDGQYLMSSLTGGVITTHSGKCTKAVP